MWIGFWLWFFKKSCRYFLCAPYDVVDVEKYRRENVNGDEGFFDHDMVDQKALGDGKSDRNETRSLDGFPKLITRVNQKE